MSNKGEPDEIDEVISSVRAWVSKTPSETEVADSLIGGGATSERLILTPALRVDDVGEPLASDDEPLATDGEEPTLVLEDSVGDVDNVFVLDAAKRTELSGLQATIAELEVATTSEPDDTWEPDEGEALAETDWAKSAFDAPDAGEFFGDIDEVEEDLSDDNAETVEVSEDVIEEEVTVAATTQEPESVLDEALSADAATDSQLEAFFPPVEEPEPKLAIDPDDLHDMIVQIVRDELAGETGERISRSVRKLVRREINQILSARDIS